MLWDRINNDYKEAFKSKDTIKKEILNFLISALKYKRIELQKDLSDDDVISVIKKEIKSRQEAVDYLQKAGKNDEANIEMQKIDIIKAYLPQMMSKENLESIVKNLISTMNIQDPKKQRGVIIQSVMKDYKSVVDPAMLNDIINNL